MKTRRFELTPFQLVILGDKMEGYTLAEIAARRGRTLTQIRGQWHGLSGVLFKLDAVNDAQAVAVAFRKGIVT